MSAEKLKLRRAAANEILGHGTPSFTRTFCQSLSATPQNWQRFAAPWQKPGLTLARPLATFRATMNNAVRQIALAVVVVGGAVASCRT
jgi:hypothetical protein